MNVKKVTIAWTQFIQVVFHLWRDASLFTSSLYPGAGKKRAAAEGVRGAPVNKRKSLLMKPRHYSPSPCSSEGDVEQDLATAHDKDAPRNTDTPAGRQMSCCVDCFDEQLTLNFKLPSVAFIYLLGPPLPLPRRIHLSVRPPPLTSPQPGQAFVYHIFLVKFKAVRLFP